MLIEIAQILTPEEVVHCRRVLEASPWVDGRVTAGQMAAKSKLNLQIPVDSKEAEELGDLVLRALGRNPTFNSAVMPLRVLPPMFNRYDVGMTFGAHVDGSIRSAPGAGLRIRTDVSSTLFLTPPEDYDGGELQIEDTYGRHSIKLPAGAMVVYPATSLHQVAPITRGVRTACFFWVQSLIRDDNRRALLYEMDGAIQRLNQTGADELARRSLIGCYHNLVREWSET